MDKRKSTGLLLSILGVISLVLITAGVTYAFFSYTKEGTTSNTIRTGAITFRYDEGATALTLNNALPMDDTTGIAQTMGDSNADPVVAGQNFEFTITSTTPSSATIPYVVTIRSVDSTLATDQVKIYLDSTDATGSNKTVVSDVVQTFSQLPTDATTSQNDTTFAWYNTSKTARGVTANDRIIYEGIVPANSSTNAYSATFKLGMWLKSGNDEADYSAYEFVRFQNGTTTINDTTGTSVATLEENGDILTSTEYYRRVNLAAGETGKITAADWTRIKYRNYTDGKVITTQTSLTAAPAGFENANEQYYPLYGKSFTVKVNVYAEGATVYE